MARRNHETKKEWLAKEVALAVNAGKAWDCETVFGVEVDAPVTVNVNEPIAPNKRLKKDCQIRCAPLPIS